MKKLKNSIISLLMIVGVFALLLSGCGKSNQELYEEDKSNVDSMYNGPGMFPYDYSDNIEGKSSREVFTEYTDQTISEIEECKMYTKEGKAVKKSALALKKQEKEFYLKYYYGDFKGTAPDVNEKLKKYYADVENKINKFNKKYNKVMK